MPQVASGKQIHLKPTFCCNVSSPLNDSIALKSSKQRPTNRITLLWMFTNHLAFELFEWNLETQQKKSHWKIGWQAPWLVYRSTVKTYLIRLLAIHQLRIFWRKFPTFWNHMRMFRYGIRFRYRQSTPVSPNVVFVHPFSSWFRLSSCVRLPILRRLMLCQMPERKYHLCEISVMTIWLIRIVRKFSRFSSICFAIAAA